MNNEAGTGPAVFAFIFEKQMAKPPGRGRRASATALRVHQGAANVHQNISKPGLNLNEICYSSRHFALARPRVTRTVTTAALTRRERVEE
jgi:hypothetical protein